MDRTYLNSKDDENDESGPPTLVVYESNAKAIWAMARESKARIEDLVDWMIHSLKDAGYAGLRITLKTDGEVSTKAVKNQTALKRERERERER